MPANTRSGICSTMLVAMKPGAIALTVMPCGPSSRAQTLVMPITPLGCPGDDDDCLVAHGTTLPPAQV